jgi:hypothetical protein
MRGMHVNKEHFTSLSSLAHELQKWFTILYPLQFAVLFTIYIRKQVPESVHICK